MAVEKMIIFRKACRANPPKHNTEPSAEVNANDFIKGTDKVKNYTTYAPQTTKHH